MDISNLGQTLNTGGLNSLNVNRNGSQKKSGTNFSSLISEHLKKVSEMENDADQKMQDFIVGKNDSIHDVVIAGEKSKLALEFTVEVRNKIVNAYKEIMRMPI